MREWRRVKSIHDLHKKPLIPNISTFLKSFPAYISEPMGYFPHRKSKSWMHADEFFFFWVHLILDLRYFEIIGLSSFLFGLSLIFFFNIKFKWESEQYVKLVAHPLSWFWLWNKWSWGPWIMELWAISHMYACDLKSTITNLLMRSEMILKAMDVQFSKNISMIPMARP